MVLQSHTNTNTATVKADLIETLGLDTTAVKAKQANVEKDVPRRKRRARKEAVPLTEDNLVAQSTLSSKPKSASPELRSTSIELGTQPSARSPTSREASVTEDKLQHSLQTVDGRAVISTNTNKRKHDSAAETTDPEQTPTKKTKTLQAISPHADTPLPMSTTVVSQAPTVTQATPTPVVDLVQAVPDQEIRPDTIRSLQYDHEPTHHDISLREQYFAAEEKNASKIIHRSNEDILITHAPLETHIPEVMWKGARTGQLETLNGGRTYTKKQNPVIYFTSNPHGCSGDASPNRSVEEMPFHKHGRHGRRGDFVNDPDLQTGRGHQIHPSDLEGKRAYEEWYYEFHKLWPHHPYVDGRKRDLVLGHVEGKARLDEAEIWMMGYREKYQGENVSHLWPCGCEKHFDGDESEEE